MTTIRPILDQMLTGDLSRARDEASRLANLECLDELRSILEASEIDAEKLYCYWMLGDLGRNTRSPLVADYLMERVAREKKPKFRKEALQRLFFLSGAKSAENAIAVLQDKNRDIRHQAISALGSTTDPRSEQVLLEMLCDDAEPETLRRATLALWRVATSRAVEPLAGLIARFPSNRFHEVSLATALLTLSRLDAEAAIRLACQKLGNSSAGFVNWASMLVLEKHGGAAQIDLVATRLTSLLNTKRKDVEYTLTLVDTKYGSELSAGVSFLRRFNDPRAKEILDVVFSKPERLFAWERSLLSSEAMDGMATDVSRSSRMR